MDHTITLKRQKKNTLKAIVSPTNLDIAWAAGIFEGEGIGDA